MANAAGDESIDSASRGCGARTEFSEEGYWTAERRARARPTPLPKLPMPKAGGDEQPATTGEALPKGPPGHIPGQPPPGWREETKLASYLEPRGDTGAAQGALEVSNPLDYPFSAVGKLFYTFRNGHEGQGTASLITPNVALTAAHCIYDKYQGGAATNVEFYPGFNKREEGDPLYSFKCSHLVWKPAWQLSENFAYDYAMVWIDGDTKKLGSIPIVCDQQLGRVWTAVGYPAMRGGVLGGLIMYASTGGHLPHGGDPPNIIRMANNGMREGSSGGPWITHPPYYNVPKPWPAYMVNGVQSRSVAPGPGLSSSPFFTHEVWLLLSYIYDEANPKKEPLPGHRH